MNHRLRGYSNPDDLVDSQSRQFHHYKYDSIESNQIPSSSTSTITTTATPSPGNPDQQNQLNHKNKNEGDYGWCGEFCAGISEFFCGGGNGPNFTEENQVADAHTR